jgi:CRP-like cAMP-binding protein
MEYAPIVNAEQMDRIRAFAKPRQVTAGEVLYNPDDDTPPVFVVITGAIKIVSVGGGEDRAVTTYTPGQFSGELLMISGRRSIYRCQAVETGALLELSAKDLRALIGKDAELNDIFMNAFLARRLSLRDKGLGNVVVLGSRYSANTLALREFLTRDGHPFTYLDLDSDQTAQELLDRFGVGTDDIPVVVCNNVRVLRNPLPRKSRKASDSTAISTIPKFAIWSSWGLGLPDWQRQSTRHPKVWTCLSWRRRPLKLAQAPRSRTTLVSRRAFPAMSWPHGPSHSRKNSAPKSWSPAAS